MTPAPRLLDGLALIPVDDGYLADGGPRRELLSGRAVRDLFPRLLPLLDGGHPATEIAASLGEPAQRIERVLALLQQHNLLDPAPRPADPRPDPMRTYLRRSLLGGSGDRVLDKLAAARVVVLGPHRIGNALTELIRRGAVSDVALNSERTNGASLVIDARLPGDESADRADHAAPWLPVRYRAGTVYIGPLRGVTVQPCSSCTGGSQPADTWESAGVAVLGTACALVASSALRFLGHGTTRLARRVIEVTDPGAPYVERVVAPRPDCASCGQPAARLDALALAEFEYEHGAEPPQRGWDPEPAPRADRCDAAPSKAYLSPAGIPTRLLSGAGKTIAWLLTRTVGQARPRAAGTDTGSLDFWVPSAAPPGSTRAYVLGDITAGGPRIHYFDAPADAFVALPGTPARMLGARFFIVFTGDSTVVGPELGPAGRRALHQDAGLAVAQLAVCAAAMGWRMRAGGDLTGELAASLDLEPSREFITSIVELSPGVRPSTTATGDRLSRWLRRVPLVYRFSGRPVAGESVIALAARALERTDAIWTEPGGPAAQLSCLLYARRVDGLEPGLFDVAADTTVRPHGDRRTMSMEKHLDDRALDPPAMLFFTGNLARTLAADGAPGYPRLLAKAATAAGLVRLAAADPAMRRKAPLVAGLFAGFPSLLAGASVFYACGVGHPAMNAPPEAGAVAW
jgi:hypothetical protein